MKTIFVGMSGGVDSSVSAALCKEMGHQVVGVYMKNWTRDLPGFTCPWEADYRDAKRVAVKLGIELLVYDFEEDYRQKVVDYMIDAYKIGQTPNPDIMCNQEIKFKLFLDKAIADGADMVATGHYAKTHDGRLFTAKNTIKDQTYFLYRVSTKALKKSVFPIGDISSKQKVRELAKKYFLPTAEKKDSQGICFVGKVGIKDFLKQFVDTKPGPIIDSNGSEIGVHDGAIFYTIGQRHGLNVGGGLPYYVTSKDVDNNTIYVTTDLDDSQLWTNKIELTSLHWITNPPNKEAKYSVRLRYRGPIIKTHIKLEGKSATLILDEKQRAIAPGQSAVIYDGDEVVGGGVVSRTQNII